MAAASSLYKKLPALGKEPPLAASASASVGGDTLRRTARDPQEEPNPFSLPEDNAELFRQRDEAAMTKKHERTAMRMLTLHDRAVVKQRPPIRALVGADEDEAAVGGVHVPPRDDMTDALDRLAVTTRDRRVEQQQLSDYVKSKRALFLLRFSLDVKKEEMQKLEQQASDEERRLQAAERQLEVDATRFDQFLRENDRSAVEAIKLAEDATRLKQNKQAEIKRLQAESMAYSSEVGKQEDTLTKLRRYRQFLAALSPTEWQEAQAERVQEYLAVRRKQHNLALQASATIRSLDGLADRDESANSAGSRKGSLVRRTSRLGDVRRSSTFQQANLSSSMRGPTAASLLQLEGEELENAWRQEMESETEPELYFTKPAQLLALFEKLEESNLSLIQNGQEAEEMLQDLKDRLEGERQVLLQDRSVMEEQIASLEDEIDQREKTAETLKQRCKYFMAAAVGDQEAELSGFDSKVEQVYLNCIGENEAGIDTLQMLTNIENRLEELFEKMQKMPADRLVDAEKEKDKERRRRLREEKLLAQKRHQEERVRRAQERAQAQPKRLHGKKLMYRSAPPEKKKTEMRKKEASAEEEERRYFFT